MLSNDLYNVFEIGITNSFARVRVSLVSEFSSIVKTRFPIDLARYRACQEIVM